MKKIIFVLLSALLVGCGQVPPGYIGVVINSWGGDKGVDTKTLPVGRYWLGFNESLYTFPTFNINYNWTRDSTEGSPNNEELIFQDIDGLPISTDLGISLSVDASKVTTLFQTYRKGIDEIVHIQIRNTVRDSLIKEASKLKVDEIYGRGKEQLIKAVEKDAQTQLSDLGVKVEHLYWIGSLRLPQSVQDTIDAKIKAVQTTLLRENEIQQVKAEAQKEIEKANGEATAKLNIAKAEAESIRMKGEAEALAIKAKSEALNTNPQLVQYTYATQWNGQLPQYNLGGSIPLLNIGK